MNDVGAGSLANRDAAAFFAAEWPLIKLFHYGADWLVYDAKPHFAFIVSTDEMNLLMDFLGGKLETDIFNTCSSQSDTCSSQSDAKVIKNLLAKFSELVNNGVFIKGPVVEISPVDRTAIKEQLAYYDANILLRKFCLEVTEDCNYRCTYCKRTIANGYRPHSKNKLSRQNAYKGIDYYFKKYTAFFQRLSREKQELLLQIVPPGISWYGGEPFLNFELIQQTADYFKQLPWEQYSIKTSDLRFASNTNLSIMNGEILTFLVDNRVSLFASLDGPAAEHDKCRVFENGAGTFHTAYRNLMKIKQFDETYFRQNVSIFGVYTDQHDYDQCLNFTRNIGALLCQHFPAEYTGAFVSRVAETNASFSDSLEQRLLNFNDKLSADSQNSEIQIEDYSNLFPFAKLNYDQPAGKNSLQIQLTCPMGFDNLMVAANGDFLICHKVDASMPIGHCDSGLDFEKLTDLNQRYNSLINNHRCKNCWNVNFCSVCAASRMTGETFVNPTPQECDYFQLRTSYDFLCFIPLALDYPELLQKIFDYRNDRKSFVGVIDINDF